MFNKLRRSMPLPPMAGGSQQPFDKQAISTALEKAQRLGSAKFLALCFLSLYCSSRLNLKSSSVQTFTVPNG